MKSNSVIYGISRIVIKFSIHANIMIIAGMINSLKNVLFIFFYFNKQIKNAVAIYTVIVS